MRHNNGEQPRHEDNHKQDIHQDNIELQQEEELIQTKIDFENDQKLAASEVQTVFFYENKDKYCWKNKCLLLANSIKRDINKFFWLLVQQIFNFLILSVMLY